jgi:ferredoxin-NADP reductase
VSTRAPAWYPATLARASAMTSTSRSLIFRVDDWPGNDAGQHVDLRLTAPDGYQAVRSYSIASVGAAPEIELAVDRFPDGEVSPFLVDEVEIGDTVEIRGPLGRWFVWRPEQTRPVQLIGGGSGVVPLVAMARAHAVAESSTPMQLLYSLRSPSDALFQTEIAAAEPSVSTTWHYTRETPGGWHREAGRLTAADLQRHTLPPDADPLIFICGPTGFVEAVSRAMIDLGHVEADIRTERFGGI